MAVSIRFSVGVFHLLSSFPAVLTGMISSTLTGLMTQIYDASNIYNSYPDFRKSQYYTGLPDGL